MKKMKKKICLITIVNSISETSMPINEFVLYRYRNYEVKQILVVCNNNKTNTDLIPKKIKVYYLSRNIWDLRRIYKKILNENSLYNCVVHMHHSTSAMLYCFASLGLKRKTIFTIHSTYGERDIIYRIPTLLSALSSNIVTCVSESSCKSLPPFLLKHKLVRHITNGVDINRVDKILGKNKKKKSDITRLIYVARVIPLKNHEFLLRVLQKLNNCELICVGNYELNSEFLKKVRDYGLSERVIMKGILSRNDVFKELINSDIYLSTSLIEGMPISVLEAMCTKLPVILSNIGPHDEIKKKCDSVIVLDLDVNKWVDKINDLINNDKLEIIGEACREEVEKEFSLSSMHNKYDVIIERLTDD